MNQTLKSQKSPHILPSWASYTVSVVKIVAKIVHIQMPVNCMLYSIKQYGGVTDQMTNVV